MADDKTMDKQEKKTHGVDIQKWKERKLRVINGMGNAAKARALAERVLANK